MELLNVTAQYRDVSLTCDLVVSKIPEEMKTVQIEDVIIPDVDLKSLKKDSKAALYLRMLSPQGMGVALHILKSWEKAGGINADKNINMFYPKMLAGAPSFKRVAEQYDNLLNQLSPEEKQVIGHDLYTASVASGPGLIGEILETIEAGT